MKDSRKGSLPAYVALAYTLIIVYASVQPLTGWRMPPPEVLAFLTAPWPRYLTAGDIVLNVAAYLPLGAMLFFVLRPPLAAAFALVLATALGALLSLVLESVQMFLPLRIASNVDLLSNTLGALLGALAALLLTTWNNPFAALRARVVRPGMVGDCGLLILALWIVIQFHPSAVALGSGNIRETLGVPPAFMHSSQTYLLNETAVVALAVSVLGLALSLLFMSRRDAVRAMVITLALTLTAKSIAAAAISRAGNWFQWITPGVAAGFIIGSIAVAVLMWTPVRMRAACAILCIAASIVVVNFMPDNPYQVPPAFLSSPPPTHLANFGSIVRVLSQVWPFAVLALLVALMRAGPPRHVR